MSLLADFAYAVRGLRRSPGFALTAVAALALALGAITAVFSAVRGVLLQPLPYRAPDRLVVVQNRYESNTHGVSEPERLAYRVERSVFAALGTYAQDWMNLTGDGAAERVRIAAMDVELLDVLGVGPALGRGFTAAEDRPGGEAVVLLSHRLWERRFGADAGALGRRIVLDGAPRTVVGVMPADFRLPSDLGDLRSDVFVPLALDPVPDQRNFHYLTAVARLQPGVSPGQAATAAAAALDRLKPVIPSLPTAMIGTVVPLHRAVFGDVRPALLVLFAATGLVLLVACANVATLMVARSETRQRELAVRRALGAARGRVLRQLVAESALIALAAAAAGALLASVAVDLVRTYGPADVPRLDAVRVDLPVLGFTLLVALATVLAFGVAPAFQASADGVATALREGAAGAGGPAVRATTRRALVVAEVALAVTLSVGAALLLRSYLRLQAVPSGLDPVQVATLQLSLPSGEYDEPEAAQRYYTALLDRVRAMPGITAAGAVSALPLRDGPGDWGVIIEGRPLPPQGQRKPYGDRLIVTDGYFRAMGIPVLAGREFEPGDRAGAEPVALVNETMARRYWPDGSAVGARFRLSSDVDTVFRRVVGVVGDVRQRGLDAELTAQFFLPHAQYPIGAGSPVQTMTLVVRGAGQPAELAGMLRREAASLDPDVAAGTPRAMSDVLAASTALRRLNTGLVAGFAGTALALVVTGIYGVISYLAARRTRELGIRMALGARPRDVVGLVMRESLVLAIAGLVLGLAGAAALGAAMRGLLFGVGATDGMAYGAASLLLLAVAAAASLVPARRAALVDPALVLRSE